MHSHLLSLVSDITSFLYCVKRRNGLSHASVACHRHYRLFAASVNCLKIVTGNAELNTSVPASVHRTVANAFKGTIN